MTTITFNGGPFDGEVRAVDDAKWDTEFGCVVRSDAVGAIKPRYAVYLPGERGDLHFHAYAPSLDAGLAMLPRENKR